MTWSDAKSLCARDGATLPGHFSDGKNIFIAELNPNQDTWLATEGTFMENNDNPYITYKGYKKIPANEPNDRNELQHSKIWSVVTGLLWGPLWGPLWWEFWNDDSEVTSDAKYLKNVVCIYKIPKDLKPLAIKASCKSAWDESVISGIYKPVAVINDKAIYEQQTPDWNGNYWSMHFNNVTNRWIFSYHPNQITVGTKRIKNPWWATTAQALAADTPGFLLNDISLTIS